LLGPRRAVITEAMASSLNDNQAPTPPERFPTTHWSIVLLARGGVSPEADQALAALCGTYWFPLYEYIRRQVNDAEQARDLTQDFFAQFLEKDFLDKVEQDRGRFRAYLLACCKHFLSNQRDRERARKRGQGRTPLSLDFCLANDRYQQEPAHSLTPERLFERRWALTLLEQVLEQLRQEYHAEGKAALYDHLKSALVCGPEALSYAAIGEELGMSEGAVKKAAQRLRQRYRDLLRQHIAATVEGPEQVEAEIRTLFTVLGS
jgi:RNA polymerase sigma factor (sigma-70 family)